MDPSISQEYHRAQNMDMDQNEDWSEESVEYLYENKIWLPGFVRSEPLITRCLFLF